MKKVDILFTIVICLVCFSFGYVLWDINFSKKEPKITLTKSQFMNIYKNGYVKGQLNEIVYWDSSLAVQDKVWTIDSTYIIEVYKNSFK